MVVRDGGNEWQVVLQTEHAELAGQFARAWSPRPEPFKPLELVTRRHDDGWFVWERGPGLDPEGRPANFLDVPVPVHLAFYKAAIVAVTEEDEYAGLILSMHGAGIYKHRYGYEEELAMRFVDEAEQPAEQFVAEQEASYPKRLARLGIDDEEAWRGYKFLQVWDRLSLYACLNELDAPQPEAISPVPFDGGETTLTLTPSGRSRVSVDPYPFATNPAEFTFERRLIPKRSWKDGAEFRRDFFATALTTATMIMAAD